MCLKFLNIINYGILFIITPIKYFSPKYLTIKCNLFMNVLNKQKIMNIIYGNNNCFPDKYKKCN